MQEHGSSDYELYLKTQELFACQSSLDKLCNADELQFQIVHQVEELIMRLITYTLIDIIDYIEQKNTPRILTLFKRVHKAQAIILNTLDLLTTMSPAEYQDIRLHLGNGSGKGSPGFKLILLLAKELWAAFEKNYLADKTIEQIYSIKYTHCDSYIIAEALLEFDANWEQFLQQHIQLVDRTIGLQARSLKGTPTKMLYDRLQLKLFPALWGIRSSMTDQWGQEYGYARESIREQAK
jgi:tryptophan 2,3-dioxygenase